MPSPLQQIKELVQYLPTKDFNIAKKLIEKKDWESLKDLTWSSLQLVETAFEKEEIPAKYKGADLDKIRELALICDEYYYLIYPEEAEIEEDLDFLYPDEENL